MSFLIGMMLSVALATAGCEPRQPRQTPFAVTLEPQVAQGIATLVPTANPAPSRTWTPLPTATFTPSRTPTVTPSPTTTLTPTATLSPTITPSATITDTPRPIASATGVDPASDPDYTPPPSWTPPPDDPASRLGDHFHLRRPISDSGVNWVDRTYPYGGTAGGRLQVHHGVEFVNPRGTPILAAADGVVYYAGSDLTTLFGPQPDYYGNLVVIQHNFASPQGQPVFTLYGHMDQIEVQAGQSVQQGLPIGKVGDSGIALGPHLHFEVRVGDPNSFGATRNPELWIYPYFKFGTVVGRVTNSAGSILLDVTLQVKSVDRPKEAVRYAFSYAGTSVNGDPEFGENFTLGDLPAGYYEVLVSEGGRARFRRIIYVYPNRATWIDVPLN